MANQGSSAERDSRAAVSYTHLEVVRNDAGAPSILLHGTAGVTAREQGVTGWFLSLIHI